MYSCIIIDDELTARRILKKYVHDTPNLNFEEEFKNAIDALEYLNSHEVDVVFLDIEMPRLSGINLAKLIDQNIKVIFTTAHREFALEGFELNAVDYLLKPISFERFLKATARITKEIGDSENRSKVDHIFVKVNKQMVKINFENLHYIEGLNNYIKIHTSHASYVVYESLSSITAKLPNSIFVRIHKSYTINVEKVKAYTRETIELSDIKLAIGPTYRNDVLALFKV